MDSSIWKRARLAAVAGIAIVAVSAFAIACGDDDDDGDDGGSNPTAAATTAPTEEPEATPSEEVLGETPGWAGGATGTVFYTKDFFCSNDPCVAGDDGMNPAGVSEPVPSVWVLVPLFDDVAGIELHCATAGQCVAHPSEIDVSAIGLGDVIPLPPHSHIIDPSEPGFSPAGETPWDVVVVGVNTRAAWDQLQAGKSIETLREVQADTTAATMDIPTDIVLFFGVR